MNTPNRGDVVRIDWLDITEDSVGDPADALPSKRRTFAVWWESKSTPQGEVIVTTSTIDSDGSHQQGWCAYPAAVVYNVIVIKRVKGHSNGRKAKSRVGSGDLPHTGS